MLWWWVCVSREGAPVVRSWNLLSLFLLCLRVAVAGGARWAKMTEWVVSLTCAFKSPPPCSMESRAINSLL